MKPVKKWCLIGTERERREYESKTSYFARIVEDLVTIEAQAMSEQVTHLVSYIQNLDKQRSSLTVKKGEQVYLVEHDEIVRLYLEDKVLQVETVETTYTSNLRLY